MGLEMRRLEVAEMGWLGGLDNVLRYVESRKRMYCGAPRICTEINRSRDF